MRKTGLVALGLVLVAFALRMYRLDVVSLRGDEAFTVVFVQRTWEGLWRGIRFIEPNPPLMYLALRIWVALTGASELATRYFSAFFGVLCVPLLYRLAREIFVERRMQVIAVTAAALMAINPYQIWHSQDVRNYTLWPALSMLALFFFWRWWKAERRAGREERGEESAIYNSPSANLAFYVVVTLASLYTHYYDAFILAAENVFVFALTFFARRWRTLARWVGAQAILAGVYLPWVLVFSNRATAYGEPSAEQSVSLLDVFSRTLATFTFGDTVPDLLRTLFWPPLALALAATLIYLARQERERALFLFLYIALPTLALYVVSIGRPLFLERYLNGVAPAYYLALAIGLSALWHWRTRWRTPAFGAAVLFFLSTAAYALSNHFYDPAYIKAPDWRAVIEFIVARRQPGDIVVQNFTDDAVTFYRNRLLHQGSPPAAQPGCDNEEGYLPVITLPKEYVPAASDEQRLQELNARCARIWFIPAQPAQWDQDRFVEKFLSRYDDREIDTRIQALRVQLYLTPRTFESRIVPVDVRVGSARLVGYRIQGARPLHVVLYWRAVQRIEQDYTVFVHLADAGDRVLAQQDNSPVGGTYPTDAWRPGELIVDAYDLPVQAAPGAYSLVVGMYDPATLTRVPVVDADGFGLSDNRVFLTQVTIPP